MLKRVLVSLMFILSFAAVSYAMDFSADVIFTGKGEKTESKMFFTKDKVRMDMSTPEKMSSISRMDKKVSWIIFHDKKIYMESPMQDAAQNPMTGGKARKPMVDEKMDGEMSRKEVGTETIDGHSCTKYLITSKSGKKQEEIYQWMAKDIMFPVKTAAVDGSWTQEYKNIKTGSPSADTFEVPSGYTKMQMPNVR
ncbi:DUF4412 domain-containing protein [Candidatus Magnetomonas plexicatena]|uniref:DUF4412 domain-containing protein n=1 Tax=Candidatus Magnetomonas plexicatena TaxID=2552947 RepID=UPI0011001C59|nr:DUF4412 domain-containing protein [Nitrospirales bacterium LBB_01]